MLELLESGNPLIGKIESPKLDLLVCLEDVARFQQTGAEFSFEDLCSPESSSAVAVYNFAA